MDSNREQQDHQDQNEGSETRIYQTPDSTLQSPAEDAHYRSIDPGKDNTFAVSNDDLHETNADRMAGSDRAGTAERKDNQVGAEQG